MPGTRSETEHRRTSAMGVGVDGPRRHRLCQNEVVADLKKWGPSVEQISRIGMDTSKHFQLHGVKMVAFFKALAPTVIGIEACGASRHWARILRSFGHEVKLIAPQLVKPYDGRHIFLAEWESTCTICGRPFIATTPQGVNPAGKSKKETCGSPRNGRPQRLRWSGTERHTA